MSSNVNIAAAAAATSHAKVQMALAAKLAKMNTLNDQSVVQLIESANASLQEAVQSALPPGVGANLDIGA